MNNLENNPEPLDEGVATRKSWFSIFSALTFSVAIYGLLCFLILQSPNPRPTNPSLPTLKIALGVMAFLCLAASVMWLRFKVDGRIGGEGRPVQLSAQEFQTHSIMAMALAEACSIFGLLFFFLGGTLSDIAMFGAGTLLVNFAFVLPRGLQFWMVHK